MNSAKVALITGAARRIGAAIARTLHDNDYRVVIHYNSSAEAATQLANELNNKRPDSANTLQASFDHSFDADSIIKSAHAFWGRLDVLVNNASSFYATEFGKFSNADWDALVGSNLRAPMFLIQAAQDALKESHGCIINMVDIHADRPLKNYPVYSAAKAGLVSLTKSAAKDLGPEIRCNGVAPGAILWPEQENDDGHNEIIQRTALKRQGEPADIAKTILFLVDQAPYITGQIIAVDGGRTLQG